MQFYSGFSLRDEEHLFSAYIKRSDFTICGFSYGAIFALNATLEALHSFKRVDTLQLFSPAFFQTKEEKFKRLQLRTYNNNEEYFMSNFFSVSFSPYPPKSLVVKETTHAELQELLEYVWNEDDLKFIASKGVKIEVYLGGLDGIIDVENARSVFLKSATVTYIKNANHFLQCD